jgi:hypothetical protein
MYKRLATAAFLLAPVLVPALAQKAHAFDLNTAMIDSPTAYSATQTITTGKQGKKKKNTFAFETFREDKNIRMDINEGDQSMSLIMSLGDGKNMMLMHELSMYQEVNQKRVKQYQANLNARFSNQQELGSESVNGYQATKYSADYQDDDGQSGTGLFWVTDDGIVIRSEMQFKRRRSVEETTINLTNLKVGDQPDELFQAPAGYSSLGLGSLFGNAMRGGQNQNRNNGPVSDQERAQDPAYSDEEQAAEPEPQESNGKRARKALGRLFGG